MVAKSNEYPADIHPHWPTLWPAGVRRPPLLKDRCRNRAALPAIGNLPPSAQPDCLRQRPIHPQQAAARAEGHLNPLRRRRAGDRPTMTPTASAKGEGATPGHPPLCASATQIRATITAKSPSAGFTAYASSSARSSLPIGRRKAPLCRQHAAAALNELLRRCEGRGGRSQASQRLRVSDSCVFPLFS